MPDKVKSAVGALLDKVYETLTRENLAGIEETTKAAIEMLESRTHPIPAQVQAMMTRHAKAELLVAIIDSDPEVMKSKQLVEYMGTRLLEQVGIESQARPDTPRVNTSPIRDKN